MAYWIAGSVFKRGERLHNIVSFDRSMDANARQMCWDQSPGVTGTTE